MRLLVSIHVTVILSVCTIDILIELMKIQNIMMYRTKKSLIECQTKYRIEKRQPNSIYLIHVK